MNTLWWWWPRVGGGWLNDSSSVLFSFSPFAPQQVIPVNYQLPVRYNTKERRWLYVVGRCVTGPTRKRTNLPCYSEISSSILPFFHRVEFAKFFHSSVLSRGSGFHLRCGRRRWLKSSSVPPQIPSYASNHMCLYLHIFSFLPVIIVHSYIFPDRCASATESSPELYIIGNLTSLMTPSVCRSVSLS